MIKCDICGKECKDNKTNSESVWILTAEMFMTSFCGICTGNRLQDLQKFHSAKPAFPPTFLETHTKPPFLMFLCLFVLLELPHFVRRTHRCMGVNRFYNYYI